MMVSASVEEKGEQEDDSKKLQKLLDTPGKNGSNEGGRRLSSFGNQNSHENCSFLVTDPRQRLVNSTSIKKQNEKSIRHYKEKNLQQKRSFKRDPSRGMSAHTKPPTLEDIIAVDNEGLKSSELSRSIHSTTPFERNELDLEIIRKAINNNMIFDQMDSDDRSEFVNAFEKVEFAKGLEIVTQGETGDFFYIIGKDSSVTFVLNGIEVGEGKDGGSFGELALIYSCPRAATVISASSPTNLFRVDRITFKSILRKQIKLKEAQKIRLLEAVDFLSEMSESDRTTLGRAMTLNFFNSGDVIVRKGDGGDAFFIVNEGQLKVSNISVGGTKFDDVTLQSGDYFGESALAKHDPLAADVTAAADGSIFQIDRQTFERVLGEFSRVIMKAQDIKIMEDIFESCDLKNQQFEELANLVVDKKFKTNQKIFTNGQPTNAAMYIIREGTVKLTEGQSDLIKSGAYFAEDLLLLDTSHGEDSVKGAPTTTLPTYTAVADEDCICGMLSLSDCRTIFDTTKMTDGKPTRDSLGACRDSLRAYSFYSTQSTTQWLAKVSVEGLRRAVEDNLKLDDLTKHEMLGEGQFGEVFLVSGFVSPEYGKQLFAMKTQKKNDPRRGDSAAIIEREIELLACMDHPYIVSLIHFYENPEEMHILMGAVYGGELFDVIHHENSDGTWSSGLPECDAKFYAMVLTDTLDYLHRKQFIYRDLKPENVLIDEDGYPIICDFGFAKFVTDKTYTLCGTPNYISPEVIMNRGHNASTDHWALGILIYEMVAGENPFYYDGMPQMDLMVCICQEKFYPLPDSASDEVFEVVDGLLEKDPGLRLGSHARRGKDIMAKEWFMGLDLDDLRQKKHKAPYIPDNEMMDRLLVEAHRNSGSESSFMSSVNFNRTLGRMKSGYWSSMSDDELVVHE